MSTVWAVRGEDGSVKHLQSRVQWLPNHTAAAQASHIQQLLADYSDMLEATDIEVRKRLSVAYIVEFIGDHVNDKLHRTLEEEHLRVLEELVNQDELGDEMRH